MQNSINNTNYQYFNRKLVNHPPLKEMKLIAISDLKINQSMINQFICVKLQQPGQRGPSIKLNFQDHKEKQIQAELFNIKETLTQIEVKQQFPQNQWIALKAPFLTNKNIIHIYDIQDIVFLSDYSVNFFLQIKNEYSESELKNKGNSHFSAKQFQLAYEYYTILIEQTQDQEMKQICLNNRAQSLISLCDYESAIQDLEIVLKNNPNNTKAQIRHAYSYQQLKQYQKAIEIYKSIEEQNQNQEVKQNLLKCEQSLQFQKGDFDLYKLFKQYVQTQSASHIHEYAGLYERKESKIAGKGLFMKQDVELGTLLFIEKAISIANLQEDTQQAELMNYRVVSELQANVIQNRLLSNIIYSLQDGDTNYGIKFKPKEFEYSYLQVDANYMRLNKIFDLNGHAFRMHVTGYDEGIWQQLAFINHSCFPNALYYYLDEYVVVVSLKNIKKGEEIFVQYKPMSEIESYKQIMRIHQIPIEEQVIKEEKLFPQDPRVMMLKEIHETQSYQKLKSLMPPFVEFVKKEYPIKYMNIIDDASMFYFRTFQFNDFFYFRTQLIEYQYKDLPQGDILYSILSVLIVSQQHDSLGNKKKQRLAEIASKFYGKSLLKDKDSFNILVQYHTKEYEYK